MITLFEKIKDVVPMGYEINLSSEILHLNIDVTFRGKTKRQCLPLSDHFTEDKVIRCIDFLVESLHK